MNQIDDLLLGESTKFQLQSLLLDPPHAIMLTGSAGSGKTTLATTLAANLLQIESNNLESYPYFFYIKRLKNKQDITIEQIREAINSLKLKVPGQQKVQRLLFVEDANFMSVPAQNALLKVLEEPPAGAVFLLSCTSAQNVLPTIASRTQILAVQQVGLNDSIGFWQEKYQPEAIKGAWRLSGGAVGLMQALLAQDQQHPLKESVELARKFLKAKTYERLLITNNLSRDKEQFGSFLDALTRILTFLHHSAIDANRSKQSENLLQGRQQLQKLRKALSANTNTKLLALSLVLHLKV